MSEVFTAQDSAASLDDRDLRSQARKTPAPSRRRWAPLRGRSRTLGAGPCRRCPCWSSKGVANPIRGRAGSLGTSPLRSPSFSRKSFVRRGPRCARRKNGPHRIPPALLVRRNAPPSRDAEWSSMTLLILAADVLVVQPEERRLPEGRTSVRFSSGGTRRAVLMRVLLGAQP